MTPLIGTDADMRYTLVWGLLALFGVVSWLLGEGPRIGEEVPENLAWGITFGLILALPLLAFGGRSLAESSNLLFKNMKPGTVLAYLVFVMPLAETLFFRGVMQKDNPFWSTALICTGWNLILFFPLMNEGAYPLIVGVILLMGNSMYGYVRERNGLAAAWICQITVNILLLFVPTAG
jgi:membrane protease YdiL (CAAX protease family)